MDARLTAFIDHGKSLGTDHGAITGSEGCLGWLNSYLGARSEYIDGR
jgi:hypothetical protein